MKYLPYVIGVIMTLLVLMVLPTGEAAQQIVENRNMSHQAIFTYPDSPIPEGEIYGIAVYQEVDGNDYSTWNSNSLEVLSGDCVVQSGVAVNTAPTQQALRATVLQGSDYCVLYIRATFLTPLSVIIERTELIVTIPTAFETNNNIWGLNLTGLVIFTVAILLTILGEWKKDNLYKIIASAAWILGMVYLIGIVSINTIASLMILLAIYLIVHFIIAKRIRA